MFRIAVPALAIVGVPAMADPPIPPNPPVKHTNQGRNVGDEVPKIGWTPFEVPKDGTGVDRMIWDQPFIAGGQWTDLLRAPEIQPLPHLGSAVLDGPRGGPHVVPAPATLGALAFGGLLFGTRRRRA